MKIETVTSEMLILKVYQAFLILINGSCLFMLRPSYPLSFRDHISVMSKVRPRAGNFFVKDGNRKQEVLLIRIVLCAVLF